MAAEQVKLNGFLRKVWESHVAKFHWSRLEAETENASEAPIQMIQTFSTIKVTFYFYFSIKFLWSHKKKINHIYWIYLTNVVKKT